SQFDVVAIGNAMVDVLAHENDDFVVAAQVERGSMSLVDGQRSDEIYALMSPSVEISGGSAGNTAAGIASVRGNAAYIGRGADDTFGKLFAHDLRSIGVTFESPLATDGLPTGRCLVIVTPDAQRTMCTYLGAGAELDVSYIDEAVIEAAAITFVE